uniref:Uncharacterized protein n=1 Tax=Meloidogyne enterolobii TaxID=390850 RepID=A0A6V7WSY0_MELEN|nr:unnamed protein product [Meloidogyne enterolobii]
MKRMDCSPKIFCLYNKQNKGLYARLCICPINLLWLYFQQFVRKGIINRGERR